MKKVEPTVGNGTEAMAQTGALCYRVTKKRGPEILLVTSRDTRRWVIPKGWLMKDRTPAEAARREALEEAGVEGQIAGEAVGLYTYDKIMADKSAQPCIVTIYPLKVSRLRSDFPERGQRRRRWFRPAKAARKVAEAELGAILAAFAPEKRNA